ncbi:MAG: histidine phosphatase family protein [Alphaproteobacteria bacterium]|jgi:broad specificity phosphatase PhoE
MNERTVTRWWWVRHAPAFRVNGGIYGNDDVPCDTTDAESFRGLARLLPEDAIWVTSHLSRTKLTAAAIVDGGAVGPEPMVEQGLGEQGFGDWQGMTHAEVEAANPEIYHKFWLAPADHAPPGGESFVDVIDRVRTVVERMTVDHGGRDIIAVAHGGTIRAALAIALGVEADRALPFCTENLSITRIDHVDGPGAGGDWRIVTVNQPPK